jgi:hypothetical protein
MDPWEAASLFVMAGLVPAIHVYKNLNASKTWMPRTSCQDALSAFVWA